MKIHLNIVSDDSGVFSASSFALHLQKVHSSPDDISDAVNYGPTHNVTQFVPQAALTQMAAALNNRLDTQAVQAIIAAARAARAARNQGPV